MGAGKPPLMAWRISSLLNGLAPHLRFVRPVGSSVSQRPFQIFEQRHPLIEPAEGEQDKQRLMRRTFFATLPHVQRGNLPKDFVLFRDGQHHTDLTADARFC